MLSSSSCKCYLFHGLLVVFRIRQNPNRPEKSSKVLHNMIVPHNLQSFNMHPLHNSPSFLKLIDEDDPIFLVKSFF
uniref:Uncharacterized protein n=1 Tax=Helianthus annuus TaxID=4232 RepID=A0A251U957_HELAN